MSSEPDLTIDPFTDRPTQEQSILAIKIDHLKQLSKVYEIQSPKKESFLHKKINDAKITVKRKLIIFNILYQIMLFRALIFC